MGLISCNSTDLIKIAGGFLGLAVVYMLLEYWLGKTDRVKPASVLEAIGWGLRLGLQTIFSFISRGKKDVGTTKGNE